MPLPSLRPLVGHLLGLSSIEMDLLLMGICSLWLALPHPLLMHSLLPATVISSRTGKPGPSRNILCGGWEGNGFTLALGPELSLLLLVEKVSPSTWKEAELSAKPRQALRTLFELLDLVTHEPSFTHRLSNHRSQYYFLCQNPSVAITVL